MVERQDIDALLISALYGELTPAEETRLAAHLESHPADRTALADLTAARTAVRESRILQVSFEPPQSVSALLMQEAARRAPKATEEQSWFQRFVRSFMLHPAMAAAATLVLVVGVATIVTNRKGDHFADSAAPATQAVTPSTPSTPSKDYGEAAGSGAGSAAAFGGNANADPAPPSGAVDQYRATLADDDGLKNNKGGLITKESDAKERDADASGKGDASAITRQVDKSKAAEATRREANNERQDSKLAKKSAVNGIELRKSEPMPKDLPAKEVATPRAKVATSGAAKTADESYDSLEQGDAGGTPRGGAGATPSTPPVAEPAPARPAQTVATKPPPAPPKTTSAPRDGRAAGEKTVDRSRAAAPAEDKPADPQLAWAREQHAAVVAAAKAGKCQNAAGLAVTLSNRAPAYYAQNVETDRSLKSCASYITAEREKDAQLRAERNRAQQKRATEAPARAADQPAKATSKPTAADSK